MSENPRLSVIVANFNRARYLGQCLDSILNQTFKELEIVVYDDGSRDGSPDLIRRYEQNCPGLVRGLGEAGNQGVAYARHQALLASRGEYVTTLDSDDYYLDAGKLSREMALVDARRGGGSREPVAFSAFVPVDENGRPQTGWIEKQPVREGRLFAAILGRTCMIPRDFVMGRPLYFAAGGYDFSLSTFEDWDLKLRLARRCDFCYTGSRGTAYRRDGKGLSARPLHEQLRNLRRVFKRYYPALESARRRQVRREFEDFAGGLWRQHHPRSGPAAEKLFAAWFRVSLRLELSIGPNDTAGPGAMVQSHE